MNIYMVLHLDIRQKPDERFLRHKIANYTISTNSKEDSVLIGIIKSGTDLNLTLLKAMDAVKDGADHGLARQVFSINVTQGKFMKSTQTCTSLPETIQLFFHRRVIQGSLRIISYTRRKGSENKWIEEDPEISYDHYVPDCGPKYTRSATNKTPIIKKTDGRDPTEEASLGNRMDTGPSENTAITLSCPISYDIEEGIFKALGYERISMRVPTVLNLNSILINVDGVIVTWSQFKDSAKGNATNKRLLEDSTTGLVKKKQLIFFKSLGDTKIVYYWLWGCMSTAENIGLLTCDTVVALQADILSQGVDNAFWLLNYIDRKKKEEHISYVYVKDRETNWRELFERTKIDILKRYTLDINKFNDIYTRKLYISIGDQRNLRRQIEEVQLDELILAILEKMIQQHDIVNRLRYTVPLGTAPSSPYQELKRYDLLSFILGRGTDETDGTPGFNIVRSRKQINLNDDNFLVPFRFLGKNLESIVLKLKKDHPLPRGGFSGGRNKFYESGPDLNDTDVEYFLRYPAVNPDIVAIDNLKKFILTKFIHTLKTEINRKNTSSGTYKIDYTELDCIIKHIHMRLFDNSTNVKISVDQSSTLSLRSIKIFSRRGDIKQHISENLGSVYSDLTYEFYVDPNYSDENISSLCRKLCKSIIDYALEIYTLENPQQPQTPRQAHSQAHMQTQNISPRGISSSHGLLSRFRHEHHGHYGGSTKNRKKYRKLSNKVSKKNKRPIRGTRKIRN